MDLKKHISLCCVRFVVILLLATVFYIPTKTYAAYELYDSFDKNTINTAIWDKIDTGNSITLTSTPGMLKTTGTSAWNNPALYSKNTFTRTGGKAMVTQFQSNVDVPVSVYHFSPTQFPTNPLNTGYGTYMQAFQVRTVVPNALVQYPVFNGAGFFRSHNYEAVTVLRPAGGSYHLISGGLFGTFPNATLVWANQSGTDSALFAGLNFYSGNSTVPEVKVVQLTGNYATQYGLANAADSFTRSDSTTLGNDEIGGKTWSEVNGNWAISNGKISNTAGGVGSAVLSNVGSEGIYETDVNIPATPTDFGILFRYSDFNNYLVAYYDSTLQAIALYKKVSGTTSLISQTGITLTANNTYRWRVLDHNNNICLYLNDSIQFGGCIVDTTHAGNTGAGLQVVGSTTTFDNVAFWPRTVTLPIAEVGTFSTVPTSSSTSLATDSFTGTNNTTLTAHSMDTGAGWTVTQGGFSLQNNTASPSAVGSIAVTNLGQTDYAVSSDITVKAGYGADTEWYAGMIVRYIDNNNYTYSRFLWQFGSTEVETWDIVNGVPSLINAVNLGSLLGKNSTHNQKVAVVGNQVGVYFDGELVAQGTTRNLTGTKGGIQIFNDVGAVTAPLSTFDNFLAQTVLSDTLPPPAITDLATTTPTTSSSVLFSWTPVYDDAAGTSYYRLYRSPTSGVLGSQINSNGATTGGSYTDSSLTSSGTYYYTARGVDINGNESTIDQNNQLAITFSAPSIVNNTQENTQQNSSSQSTTTQCTNQKPMASPHLFQANPTGNAVTLYFVPVNSPVDRYAISYGLTPGDKRYNVVFNQGRSSGAIAYTINALEPNKTYYFRVRAYNGCMPGDWGNELKVVTNKKGNIVRINTTATIKPASTNSCEYTVVPGDSLSKIAKHKLGNSTSYEIIKDKNKNKYPSLSNSTIIRVGWTLQVGC